MFHIFRRRFRFGYILIGFIILLLWLNRRKQNDQLLTFQEDPQEMKFPPKPLQDKISHAVLKTDVDALSRDSESTTFQTFSTRVPPEIDDLKRIEGIGPKISSVLKEAGINSYSKLASMSSDEIRNVLKSEGIYTANPDSWPKQAKLAAAGRWERLEALQRELKGGRRNA